MKTMLNDPLMTRKEIVKWLSYNLKDQYCNPKEAVIGISGGKDSTIAAALCVEAVGNERVTGVMMPDNVQFDIGDSEEVVELLGIKSRTINVGRAAREVSTSFDHQEGVLVNILPRIRMTTLYAVAASIPGGARVINTTNLSEIFIGYTTKWGDNVGDLGPLRDLTASEVVQIGMTYTNPHDDIFIPERLIVKPPEDGLTGRTDEEALGFSYDELDKYIRERESFKNGPRKGSQAIIWDKWSAGIHKHVNIPTFHLSHQKIEPLNSERR